MFHLQLPVAPLDVTARFQVYREYIERHTELKDINIGAHNDMILLASDEISGASSAVLVARGQPGDLVKFPLHEHGKGEIQVCLEGTYGELLAPDTCVDDIFPWGDTLTSFQDRFPGVVSLKETQAGRIIELGPGAGWNFVGGSQHAPVGWIGRSGLLVAQIYWPGPNKVLSPSSDALAQA